MLWAGIFLVYGFPVSGDVKQFYQPQGRAALSGRIPNADFTSWYMPGFAYLMGTVDYFGARDLSIPFFLILCFALASLLLPGHFRNAGKEPEAAWILTVAGVLNGASWVLAVGYQQDEALLLLLAVITMLLIFDDREMTAGVVLGLGLFFTKILFLLSAGALGLHARRRYRLALGATLSFGLS